MEYDKRLIKCTKGGSANVNGGPEDKALLHTQAHSDPLPFLPGLDTQT